MQYTSPNDIEQWLINLQVAFETGELECPYFLKPYHLVTLALMMKNHNTHELELPDNILDYAIRMNLWRAAGIQAPYHVNRLPAQNRFIPVQPLEDQSNCDAISKRLSKLIQSNRPHIGDVPDLSLYEPIYELVSNTYAHAAIKEGLFGLVCAQTWPKGNLVQVAFADTGIGIRASLQQNHSLCNQLTINNACQLACQYGITSKPNHHSGYGLSLAKELMSNHQGHICVISGNERYFSHKKDNARTFQRSLWHGTLIVLEWPISQSLDVLQVYNDWPMSQGFSGEDFFDD